jgi:hypothetical protein
MWPVNEKGLKTNDLKDRVKGGTLKNESTCRLNSNATWEASVRTRGGYRCRQGQRDCKLAFETR